MGELYKHVLACKVVMNGEFSYHLLYQALNVFISAVKLGTLT